MIIVSDTTPIISLLKIGRLGLLQKLFGEILIPKAVYDELTVNKQYVEEAKKVLESSYIKYKSCCRIKYGSCQNPEDGWLQGWIKGKVKQLCLQMNGKQTFCSWMRQRAGLFPVKWE